MLILDYLISEVISLLHIKQLNCFVNIVPLNYRYLQSWTPSQQTEDEFPNEECLSLDSVEQIKNEGIILSI